MVQRKQNRRHRRSARAIRQSAGMYIVEALVAMVICGIVSFALLDMVAGTMRTMTRANRDSQAYELVEELTEFTRAYGYRRLLNYKDQSMVLTINKEDGAVFQNTDFHNRAILFDFVRRQWSDRTKGNRFEGTLTYGVFGRPEPDTLDVAIDLEWVDNYTAAKRSLGRVIVVINVPE